MRKFIFLIVIVLTGLPVYILAQGCMTSSSAEGVQVIGYIQPQFNYTFAKDPNIDGSKDIGSFSFNRARLGVMGNIPYDFSYYALAELSPFKKVNGRNAPFLLDAFISYNRFKWAKISIGQFKSPFGLELGQTACFDIKTVNRSNMVNNLTAPDRDMGIMVSGGGDSTVFSYQLAFMNGKGLTLEDDNLSKDFLGRVSIRPLDFIQVGASFKYGKMKSMVPGNDEDTTMRFGADLQVKKGKFLFQGEYIWGKDDGTYSTGSQCVGDYQLHVGSLTRWGFFSQVLYMTKWNVQPVVKYEMYQTNAKVSDMNNLITFGLNYYFNDWTRLQLNYVYSAEEKKEVKNDQVLLQLQVKF